MEPMSSCDDGMDTKFASSRCKTKKTVLNRRPSGYWKVFSNWWRGRYAALKTRPTVHEVIEWYHRNAASSWPAGQVPCLKAVLRQSKGLRPIDGLKEYFREYRKKRKQQGGLALKAAEEASGRRARPTKRRRGRAAQRDSSDEDEMEELENDASGLSDQMASDDEDDVIEAEADPAALEDGPRQLHAASPPSANCGHAFPGSGGVCPPHGHGGLMPSAAHAVFSSWQQQAGGNGQCLVSVDGVAPSPIPVGMIPVLDCAMPAPEALDAAAAEQLSFVQMPQSLSGLGDPVHPGVASGMVPVSPSSSPSVQDLTQHVVAKHPGSLMYPGRPASAPPFTVIMAVPVRNCQPLRRVAMLRCGGASLVLPPLSCAAEMAAAGRVVMADAAWTDATSPQVDPPKGRTAELKAELVDGEDHADDRCSTGGGVPAGGHVGLLRPYMHHDGMTDGYEYPSAYGPIPMPYFGYPPHHGCCFRPPHCAAPYPYRAMAPGGSSGGAGVGVSSSFNSAPWSRPPTDGGMHALHTRQPSVESPAQAESCYAHAWQPPPCGAWGMYGIEGPWPGHPRMFCAKGAPCSCSGRQAPPPQHVPSRAFPPCCPAGPGCSCGGCGDPAMFFGRGGPHMGPRGACPMYLRPGAGHPLFGGSYPPEAAWEAAREAKREGAGVDGETCSSSVSEQQQLTSDAVPCQPQELGRWSPCSGASGLSPFNQGLLPRPQPFTGGGTVYGHAGGFQYLPAYYPAMARGMVNAGSVTSMPSMAAAADEAAAFAAAGAARGRAPGAIPFSHQEQGQAPATQASEADATGTPDADVSPYFNDASDIAAAGAVSDAARDATKAAARAEQQPMTMEGGDCGLGVDDGFASVARESMDPDLAFAWENFVACDTAFESALACH